MNRTANAVFRLCSAVFGLLLALIGVSFYAGQQNRRATAAEISNRKLAARVSDLESTIAVKQIIQDGLMADRHYYETRYGKVDPVELNKELHPEDKHGFHFRG